ncbi:hypothetical protein [Francisella philomiragia]|uniref:hypothetical protein n=1 Tax=Francisella philomiragia TaxID=28110 RepID=UPI001C9DD14A|nr:hypothetical protein [Francisella philomiragia]MBY7733705.1 hypothetical protein [Francisella philomiragia]
MAKNDAVKFTMNSKDGTFAAPPSNIHLKLKAEGAPPSKVKPITDKKKTKDKNK